MNDPSDFWVEPGCAPGMDREQTEAYLRQLEAAYQGKGDPRFAEALIAEARSALNPPRPGPDEAAIGAWERAQRVRLPDTLRNALQTQDGGYVRGTRFRIRRLAEIGPLNGEEWAHLNHDGRWQEDFGDVSRLYAVGADEQVGGVAILDDNVGPEPRVLWLWADLGGEIRDHGERTFDEMIAKQRASVDARLVDRRAVRKRRNSRS